MWLDCSCRCASEPLAATLAARAFAPSLPMLLLNRASVASEPLAATLAARAFAPSSPMLLPFRMSFASEPLAPSHLVARRQRLDLVVAEVEHLQQPPPDGAS